MFNFNLIEAVPYVAGGLMISLAIALNHRFGKRVTEPSSSLYSMLTLDSHSQWRSSFVAGMLFASALIASMYGFNEIENTHIKPFESEKLFFTGTGLVQFIISGLLIGMGTRLARGGLTKYALYGIPKFNMESIIMTGTVLVFGVITATLRSNHPILQGLNVTKKFNEHLDFRLSFVIPLCIFLFNLARNYRYPILVKDILRSFGIGCLLAMGMMISGLARRHQVLDFLSLNSRWNPFLIFVVLGAILGNMIFLNVFPMRTIIEDAPQGLITKKMLFGCALFGVGLGVSGMTPGSGLLVSPVYVPQILLFFLPFVLIGQFVGGSVDHHYLSKEHKLHKAF